jgi:hypothetical protein
MPRYFFHLIDGKNRSPDEDGAEYLNLEVAFLDAWKAALDISFEMLSKRDNPSGHRFEIADEVGDVLADLPFTEVLRPSGPALSAARTTTLGLARRESARSRRLVAELTVELAATRKTLQETRAVLDRARSQDALRSA